jgi:hypothetical protein
VIFASEEASAKLLLGLNVIVNEPLPLDELPESAVTPEIYPNEHPEVYAKRLVLRRAPVEVTLVVELDAGLASQFVLKLVGFEAFGYFVPDVF